MPRPDLRLCPRNTFCKAAEAHIESHRDCMGTKASASAVPSSVEGAQSLMQHVIVWWASGAGSLTSMCLAGTYCKSPHRILQQQHDVYRSSQCTCACTSAYSMPEANNKGVAARGAVPSHKLWLAGTALGRFHPGTWAADTVVYACASNVQRCAIAVPGQRVGATEARSQPGAASDCEPFGRRRSWQDQPGLLNASQKTVLRVFVRRVIVCTVSPVARWVVSIVVIGAGPEQADSAD